MQKISLLTKTLKVNLSIFIVEARYLQNNVIVLNKT